jgi:hypothetical protein
MPRQDLSQIDANVATTAAYDRRGDDAKRSALELIHVPYVAPREGVPSE